MNAIWLAMTGRQDPRWLTYRQAQNLDAQVRKGERATRIEYWLWEETRPLLDANGRQKFDQDGKAVKKKVRLDRPKVFYALVFNAGQIDGLSPLQAPKITFDPIEKAEAILKTSFAPIRYDQNDHAFYNHQSDSIHLPAREQFDSAYEFYSTALHEIGHATGHSERLNRKFGPYGSEIYAKEELRAEIGAFMLTTQLGLGHYPDRHAGYVESWLKILKNDPNEIFRAARDAEKIQSWVMEPEKRLELSRQSGQRKNANKMTKEPSAGIDAAPAAPQHKAQSQKQAPLQGRAQKQDRSYINVPYAEKEEAKKRGAKWDKSAKSWYVADKTQIGQFAKWMAKSQERAPLPDPVEEYTARLLDYGMKLDGPAKMDGEWHRVSVESDRKGQKSGVYRGFLDGVPNGQFLNFRVSEKSESWVATANRSLTKAEHAVLQEEIKERQKERQAEKLAKQKIAKARACAMWMNAHEKAAKSHPYLQKKNIRTKGLKQNDKGQLLVPLKNSDGQILSLQIIDADGQKRFLKDGQKQGLMYVIDDHLLPKHGKKEIIVCEGLATGATLAEATGRLTVVAFDKNNLKPVIDKLQEKNRDLDILIAGDNDHHLETKPGVMKNVGMIAARDAAKATGSKLVLPDLTEKEKKQGLTDFNDIANSSGLDEVRMQLGCDHRKRPSRLKIFNKSEEMIMDIF